MQEGVFISYKRSHSSIEAHTIYFALKNEGLLPYMDVHNKETGEFPEHIAKAIRKSKYFILICTKGSMDNLKNVDDWVRREIIIAKEENVKIIPVYFPGFEKNALNTVKLDLTEAVEILDTTQVKDRIASLIALVKDCTNQKQLTSILLESLQNGVNVKKISEYVLGSREMQSKEKTEIHLLTNNLVDYDFTVIAKMAISANIQRDIKYIYYVPHNCIQDYYSLKNQIAHYAKKTEQALCEIDSWLRTLYIFNLPQTQQAIFWLSGLKKRRVSEIAAFLTDVPSKQNQIKKFLEEIGIYDWNDIQSQVLDISPILDFLEGTANISPDLFSILDTMHKVSDIITTDIEELPDDSQSWIDNLSFIELIYDFSKWVNQPIKDTSTSLKAKSFFKTFFKDFDKDLQIFDWLCEKPISDNDFENSIQNLVVHEIDEKRLRLDTCYNFSLFFRGDSSILIGSWYLATRRNYSRFRGDNNVIVCDLAGEQLNKLYAVLKYIQDNL